MLRFVGGVFLVLLLCLTCCAAADEPLWARPGSSPARDRSSPPTISQAQPARSVSSAKYYWFNVTLGPCTSVCDYVSDPYVRSLQGCQELETTSSYMYLSCAQDYSFEIGVRINPEGYSNELLYSTDLSYTYTDGNSGRLTIPGEVQVLEVESSGTTFLEYFSYELCGTDGVHCTLNTTVPVTYPSESYDVTESYADMPSTAEHEYSFSSYSSYTFSMTTVTASLSSGEEISSSLQIIYEQSVPDDLDDSYPYEVAVTIDGCTRGCLAVEEVYFDGAYGCIATEMSTTLVTLRCSPNYGFELMATVQLSDSKAMENLAESNLGEMLLLNMHSSTYDVPGGPSGILSVDGDCPSTAASGSADDHDVVVAISFCLETADSGSYWWILLVLALVCVIVLVLVVVALAFWKRDVIIVKLKGSDQPQYHIIDEDM